MKKIAIALVTVLVSFSAFGQDVSGQWNGTLKVQGVELRLVFNINKTAAGGYTSTMDSPDQGAKGIPVSSTSFANGTLKLSAANLGIEYEGTLDADGDINGTFKQGGLSLPLVLSQGAAKERPRPQEPVKPYPYREEEVSFENKEDGVTLAGTLTLPEKGSLFPAVVLISGSGAQNRDEEVMGHKPFLVLADYLTRNGIAVLRYDDRGTAASTGNFKTATSFDFSKDAEAGVNYLLARKEIDRKKIGLIGSSEGGMIAPMIAARSKDVAFIVLLAGPGIPGDRLLLLQQELIGRGYGTGEQDVQKQVAVYRKAFELIRNSTQPEKLAADLTSHFQEALKETPSVKPEQVSEEGFIRQQVREATTPWMQYFLTYDPVPALEKVQCPVLAINGAKDLQVPPKINLDAIRQALSKGGNKKATIKELPGLNHLLQECETGLPLEYGTIEQTLSPLALEEIQRWIAKQ
ncbi:alpha/beta hydrolase [Bacteroidia bacterium]|nr:alpha/beta hydrolase [Bacteroidia bacterium]